LLVEAKQLYRESVAYIRADLEQLAKLDTTSLLAGYGFTAPVADRFEVALCDCWSATEEQRGQRMISYVATSTRLSVSPTDTRDVLMRNAFRFAGRTYLI
jgi:hypothetical protein